MVRKYWITIYGYAVGGDSVRTSCLEIKMYNWLEYPECQENNWLYKNTYSQWTITPKIDPIGINFTATNVIAIYKTGRPSGYHATGKEELDIHAVPVLYLKTNVYIKSGTGTKEDSYKLTILHIHDIM